MATVLGENAKKWMKIILSFHGDPSKYGLPKKTFGLPKVEGNPDDPQVYLDIARKKWQKINARHINPYDNLEETVPYWMVFTLPRRPAMLYLAVWDEYLERKDRNMYQDVQYTFHELFQNFMREELKLIKLVRPFRRRTGNTILMTMNHMTETMDNTIMTIIEKYTSPQKILHNIAFFVKDKTVQSGFAYILYLEEFSKLMARTKRADQIEKLTTKFRSEIDRLSNVSFKPKIPTPERVDKQIPEDVTNEEEHPTAIEFDYIEIQEYDGFVEISGEAAEESRKFRIYNCIEEDLLREEIWKNKSSDRHYPIRRLVDEILEERYSRPNKEYKLKYGVEIKILRPNWLT